MSRVMAAAAAAGATLSQTATTNAAFFAIFGLFMVAMVVLIVIILVWAIRHDVAGRAAWRQRQEARQNGHEPPPPGSAP